MPIWCVRCDSGGGTDVEHRPKILWLGAWPCSMGLPGPAAADPVSDRVDVEFLDEAAGLESRLSTGRYDILVVSFDAGSLDPAVIGDASLIKPGLPVVACLETYNEAEFRAALRAGAQECLLRGELSGERLLSVVVSAKIRQWCADEQKRRDARLNQAAKTEALEQLAGGVAHDFNNLLTSILGYSRFAYDALPEGHPGREDIGEIMEAGDRAAEITRALLTFARRGLMQRSPLDVNTALEGILPSLVRVLGSEVKLEIVPAEGPAMMLGDAAAIQEMFMILATQARDAMPSGGVFSIRVQRPGSGESMEGAQANIRIVVRDTGCGMDSKTVERAFEPFSSTKTQDKGAGLRLSSVYGIVEHQDGQIELNSTPGKGTEFVITFPFVAEAVGAGPAASVVEEAGKNGRILLVEDEAAVRRFAARVLREAGYEVIEAGDGEAGVAAYHQVQGDVDLIFTDVVMPKLHGPAMVMKLRQEGVGCGVLYATGYSQQAITRLGMEAANGPVMLKPYTQQTLLSKVREVMEAAVPEADIPEG